MGGENKCVGVGGKWTREKKCGKNEGSDVRVEW